MTDHPTPGSPLLADDVGLLKRGDEQLLATFAHIKKLLRSHKPFHVRIGEALIGRLELEGVTEADYDRLFPTDRRAEAEACKKHGPKCWGRTSYSDEMAHCYCTDTPPSAGLDAGLETQGFVRRAKGSRRGWTFMDDPEDIDFYTSEDRPERYEVRELVTRQSAAAALEAAAEREKHLLERIETARVARVEQNRQLVTLDAQVADRDKRIAELEAAMEGIRPLISRADGHDYEMHAEEILAFGQALSAIPTQGRE